MKTVYVRPNRITPATVMYLVDGEAEKITVDWSAKAYSDDTSVSSVTWSVESGNATSTGAVLTGNAATSLITADNTDDSVIYATATMADGQIDIVKITVLVA